MIKMIIYNCMVIGYKWLLKILEMGKTVGNVCVCVCVAWKCKYFNNFCKTLVLKCTYLLYY